MRRHGKIVRTVGAVAAVLMASGCSGSGARPVSETVTDATITAAVRTRLAADPDLAPYRIGVSTHDAVVTLTGRVAREAQRDRAARLAEEAEGVNAVTNLIRVGDREPSAPRSNL